MIIATNAPWRRFALDNGIVAGEPAPGTDVGANYLAVCRNRAGVAQGGFAMTPPSLAEIVGKLRALPSFPTVVMELLQTMGEEDVAIDRLARGIGNDQALAARTLRVANSPFTACRERSPRSPKRSPCWGSSMSAHW